MNIVQITPGAGGMYCGGCFRDNDLVAALRQQGHAALMIPLYLPLKLDEPDESAGTPIFYGGINVYLDQKSQLFRRAPAWLHRLLTARPLLNWAAGRAAKTRAEDEDVGELTLSMLRGEEGRQAPELDSLIRWLKTQPKPDVICLSNALLVGTARRLNAELGAPIVCLLAGEDGFLDGLPVSARAAAWQTLAERCRDVTLFLPPSRYFADLMTRRLELAPGQVRIVPNGIHLAGYPSPEEVETASATLPGPDPAPVLGYFARMCPQKGLDTLVDAYLILRQHENGKRLRLHIGGGCGPGDQRFVEEQRAKLAAAGALADTSFFPNVDHAAKIAFYRGLTLFSTPARYGEAFGLYVLEALAAGVPVVQPRHAAFPELVAETGGGLLCEPEDARDLADRLGELLDDPERARALGARGRRRVFEHFSRERMAEHFLEAHAAARAGVLAVS